MTEAGFTHGIPENPYNPHCWIIGEPEIGDDCWIGAFTVLDGSGGLTIGHGCDLSCGVQIYTHSTVGRVVAGRRGELPPDRRPTRIGNHCHLGANAVILMGSTIGDHSVVGAGAVVREGTVAPPWSVIVGVPARIFEGRARALAHGGHADPEANG